MENNLTIGDNKAQHQEFALQRISVRYRALLDLNKDAVLVVGFPGGIVQEANPACIEMLGYPGHELAGMCISAFMKEVPASYDFSGEALTEHVQKLLWEEATWRSRDGHEMPVRMTIKKIDSPGESIFMIIARDIRELKENEKALMASDARYYDLVENSGEGLGIVDTDEYFTFVNPAACEIFGLPAEKLIGTNLNSFLDPQSIEEIKIQTAIRKEGQQSRYELEIIRLDGQRRWIIVSATPQYNAARKFISTFGIFRDITERKLAEMQIRESERRLHAIVDITNDWIWEIDPAWKYSFVSPKVFHILGYLPEEMIGKSPFDFLLPEDVAKVMEGVRGLVHEYKPLNAIVNRAKHKNGELVYLETSGIAVFNEQGLYKGYRGADRDITLRKLYERELIVAKEKAEESDRLKSSILANMSHELRTPLNGILGFAEILKEELGNSDYESMVENIHNSGTRLMSTLNSIIILSQLEAGKIDLSRKIVNLESIILQVVKSLEYLTSEKNIYINTDDIKTFSINTDEHLLKQLLQQILDNAIKFTEKGGISLGMHEVTEAGKKWVIIKISDTGIGIERTYFDLIFQEFRQVSEGFGRKYQGSGIGLAISKKIIDLLGGWINIDSEPGKGSCFSIYLPLEPDSEPVQRSIPVEVPAKPVEMEVAVSENLPVILLIEDNPINKDLTILFLKNICSVDDAPDAITAIDMARNKAYQAILMDINLGYGMNGIEATREIRQIIGYENTPIVAVTGYTMAEELAQFYAAGCTHHIAKPFSKHTILKIMQEILHGN